MCIVSWTDIYYFAMIVGLLSTVRHTDTWIQTLSPCVSVLIYVCMYVCLFVCLLVCLSVCVAGSYSVSMAGWQLPCRVMLKLCYVYHVMNTSNYCTTTAVDRQTHTHIHTYMQRYFSMCVCVCLFKSIGFIYFQNS